MIINNNINLKKEKFHHHLMNNYHHFLILTHLLTLHLYKVFDPLNMNNKFLMLIINLKAVNNKQNNLEGNVLLVTSFILHLIMKNLIKMIPKKINLCL